MLGHDIQLRLRCFQLKAFCLSVDEEFWLRFDAEGVKFEGADAASALLALALGLQDDLLHNDYTVL